MSRAVPMVSVVMPVLDAERFVATAMRSILGQTVRDLELIVVDNGSTDRTPGLVRAAADDPRVRPITLPRPDLVAALNTGIEAARAPLVARMDADDVAHPRRLERQLALLADAPEVAAVSCWYRVVDEAGRETGRVHHPTRRQGLGELMRHYCLFLSSGATMRRSAVLEVGGFHPSFPPAEDYDLWLRLLDAGHHLDCVPEILVDYRVVTSGLTLTRGGIQRRRASRAVTASRLRAAGLTLDPADVEAMSDEELLGCIPSDLLPGHRLVLEGLDADRIAAADRRELRSAAARARARLSGASGDADLALLAYRIAGRARRLGMVAMAAAWYRRAFRLRPALIGALAGRGLAGRLRRG